ncbi:hypothetical protein, partial [Enterococcus faecium]|uniref:hypothetical protein n=1 Tax=Enterococcus faecium TaxID=1352 RepID=UPI003D24767D
SVDRDISDTYFNKMCQRIKAMNYSGLLLLFLKLIRTLLFVLPSVRFETHFQKNQLNQKASSDRRALNDQLLFWLQ